MAFGRGRKVRLGGTGRKHTCPGPVGSDDDRVPEKGRMYVQPGKAAKATMLG